MRLREFALFSGTKTGTMEQNMYKKQNWLSVVSALSCATLLHCGALPEYEDELAARRQERVISAKLTLATPSMFSTGTGVTQIKKSGGGASEPSVECRGPVCELWFPLPAMGSSYEIVMDAVPDRGSAFGEWVYGCLPLGGDKFETQCRIPVQHDSDDWIVFNVFKKLLCEPRSTEPCSACVSGTGIPVTTINKNDGKRTCEGSGLSWSPVCIPNPSAVTLYAQEPTWMHSCGFENGTDWLVAEGTGTGPAGCAAQQGPRKPLVPGNYIVKYIFSVEDGPVLLNVDAFDYTKRELLTASAPEIYSIGTHQKEIVIRADDCRDLEFRVHYFTGGTLRIHSTQITPRP